MAMTTQQMSVETDGLDVKSIKSIEVAGEGWRTVTNPQFVQFAIGESHSPLVPSKLYPTLRYEDEYGRTIRTPLKQILSFSEQSADPVRR